MAKIYCFIEGEWGDSDVSVIAVAEDGHVLARHVSSSEGWAQHDIGIGSEWKHDKYREHYPDGYELVWGEPPPEVIERNQALRVTDPTP
jgi:hypothetical protein